MTRFVDSMLGPRSGTEHRVPKGPLGVIRGAATGAPARRPSTGRLTIGYAVMAGVLAVAALISFSLGSMRGAAPAVTGSYRLDPPSSCLGARVEMVQSGRFVDLSAENGSGGNLEVDGRRFRGEVRCEDGSVAPVLATVADGGKERSLGLRVGADPVRAVFLRDPSSPAEAPAPSSGELSPERLFGRLMLAIAVAILAARAAGAIVGRIGQPRVMGEIVAGILLGPTLLGALLPDVQGYLFPPQVVPLLSSAADIGLAFYMFLVGMEVDLRVLRGRVAQAAFISNAGVVLPMALGIALALPLFSLIGPHTGYAPFALFMGVAMSVTAFPVLARILMERRMLRRPVGALAMASAAVDDVSAWVLLAIATAMAAPGGSSLTALRIVGLTVAFSAGMAVVIRRLVGRVSEAYDEAGHVPGGWVAGIFVGVLVSAYVASWIGVAAIFGAFVMGLIMPRRADLTRDVTRRLEDFVGTVMLPLFFVVTGLRVDIGLLGRPALWVLTLVLIGVAVAGKWVGVAAAARYTGLRTRASMALGALMNTRGLTELIVLTVGLNYGVISPALFTMLVIVALVTTFMTGPALRLIDPRGELSSSPEEELRDAPTGGEAVSGFPFAEGSIVVAPQDEQSLDALVALAEPLARADPPRELILVRLVEPPGAPTGGAIAGERALSAATEALQRRRDELVGRGVAARAMACFSADPGGDLVRLATLPEVDLVLVDGRRPLRGEVPAGDVGTCLEQAPCNVAVLVNQGGAVPELGPGRPVTIPFGGQDHDWAAVRLGVWIARSTGAPIRLIGSTGDSDIERLEATEAVADASRAVQNLTGLEVDAVVVSRPKVRAACRGASLLVVGLPERWLQEGLGLAHSEVARTVPAPVLLVRPGDPPEVPGPLKGVAQVSRAANSAGPGEAPDGEGAPDGAVSISGRRRT